jgi:hypothetical protein
MFVIEHFIPYASAQTRCTVALRLGCPKLSERECVRSFDEITSGNITIRPR